MAPTRRRASRRPVYLEGTKLYLSPFVREHLETPAYRGWLNDLATTKEMGGGPDYVMPVSAEQLERYFERNAFSRDDVFFAVHERAGDRFIGTLRVSHINWLTRTAEIGIMIGDREARGRGYASEMVELAVAYAFDALNLRKLVAGAHAGNEVSARCFERLGFKPEAVLREHAFVDGRYVDVRRYALFEHEYRARSRGPVDA